MSGWVNWGDWHGPSRNGLLAWYNFAQGANADTLYDISGNGRHMALNGWGAADTKWTAEGLYFDASKSQYCQIADSPELSITGDVWIEAVVKADLAAVRGVIAKGNNTEYTVRMEAASNLALFRGGVARSSTTRFTVPSMSATWVHLSVSFRGTAIEACVNGSGPWPGNDVLPVGSDSTQPLRIGTRALTDYFLGTIASLRLYNRAPSREERRANYRCDRRLLRDRGILLPCEPQPRPMMSLTVDDGVASTYSDWAPLFASKGVAGTSYMVSDWVGTVGYMTAEQLVALQAAGWEIGSHTKSHAHLAALTAAEVTTELSASKTALEALGLRVHNIAYPWGEYNDTVRVEAAKLYRTGRQTIGTPPDNTDPVNLWAVSSYSGDDSGNTLAQLQAAADVAAQRNGWLVVMLHGATAGSLARMTSLIDYAKGLGIDCVTVNEAMNRWLP